MRLRTFLLSIFALSVPHLLTARIVHTWTYQEMFDKADLVVIAAWVSTKETGDRSILKDIDPPLEGIGADSEFQSRLILKGSKEIKKFRLHHYKLKDGENIANGPRLIRIEPRTHPTFLLFLIREKSGSYAPVTGQTDPAGFSVLELPGAAQ